MTLYSVLLLKIICLKDTKRACDCGHRLFIMLQFVIARKQLRWQQLH